MIFVALLFYSLAFVSCSFCVQRSLVPELRPFHPIRLPYLLSSLFLNPLVPLVFFIAPWRWQDMPEDVFYSVENLRLGVGEIEAFLIDVLAGMYDR